jgi:hypothetical protein
MSSQSYCPLLRIVGSVAIALFTGVRAFAEANDAKLDFNRDIRPILSENCYACHGPDKNKRKADLRLDTKDGLFNEMAGAWPIIPNKPDQSDLLRRIALPSDDDDHMPPAKCHKLVTPEQIAKVKRWIEQGAPYKGHWAYIKPTRPPEPDVSGSPARNPIDKFIAEKRREHGLTPAAEADKITLCRRVYFDLLGLPPTPSQFDEFVKDARPDAFERLVDQLLANPHFGERMAVFWLDQVRYADTIGYHSDNPMNVWPYRDWVIAAFNQNMPFDRFTIEQIAGDLLPDSGVPQKVASAYNRLLQTTEEGGAQPREYEAKYAADRVRNLSAVWLAQTMGCCECHDHKFDPITTKEFYGVEAFFADVQEAPVGKREAGMPLPDAKQQEQLKKFDEGIAAAKGKLAVETPELAAARSEWEKTIAAPVKWDVLDPQTFVVQGESKLKKLDGGVLQTVYKVAARENYVITAHADAKAITGIRLEALVDDALPAHGPGNAPNGNFVLTDVKVSAAGKDGKPADIPLAAASADTAQESFPVASIVDPKRKNRTTGGWAILPQVGKPHEALFEFAQPIASADGGSTLTITLEFQSIYAQHTIGKLRLSCTTTPQPSRAALPKNVREALAIDPAKRTDAQKQTIATYYHTVAPLLAPIRQQIASLEQQKQQLLDSLPKCLVTTAGSPHTVHFLARGNWLDTTGPEMKPVVPAALGAIDASDRRPTRLDLARWIVSRDNPLTARVLINRLWKLFYGQGIARKVDDFGSQGDWPTHPELLDWLAIEFIEHNWDIKHMVRLMVTSATYRQSSIPTKEQLERDPANLWLARQARFRLDAEFVRDNALAVSGLLVDKLGGKSVFPYQPAGYWTFLNFPPREWQNDKGEGLYRRGLYTHWQRTFLHPSLLAFDAPTREEAVCERTRSNVPQQALVLLNDPTYVEAARTFAARIVRDGGTTTEQRLSFAFHEALSRPPRPAEANLLGDLLDKHSKEYAADAPAAQKLLTIGDAPAPKDSNSAELAAWTSVARTILNLHEMITRQ